MVDTKSNEMPIDEILTTNRSIHLGRNPASRKDKIGLERTSEDPTKLIHAGYGIVLLQQDRCLCRMLHVQA